MPRIPEAVVEQLKQNIPLVRLCRDRGIELKKAGRREFIGKCPFHTDRNASFSVNAEKNLFHCLGCDASGSNVDFLMKAEGLTFRQAVEKLLALAPEPPTAPRKVEPPPPARLEVKPERAATLLGKVVSTYERTFSETPEARTYLESRGITEAGLFSRHRLGYSNGQLNEILPKDGHTRQQLQELGLLLHDGSERFLGCVVFPIFDVEGQITTLYGRKINHGGHGEHGEERRHFFLPERSTGLWNVGTLKTHSEIILVESVIDALSVMTAGFPNVVAIQGTNGLGDKDVALFQAHGVRAVTLLLDGDEAGAKATSKLRSRLETAGLAVTVKALPENEDPNSYLTSHGAETLGRFLACDAWTPNEMKAGAPAPTVGRTIRFGLRAYEIKGLEKGPRKLRVTLRVEHNGRLHVDTLDLYHARARRNLAFDLCRVFNEPAETVEADIEKLLRHCESLPEQRPETDAPEGRPAKTMTATEREEAETFGKRPDLFERILADFETGGLIGEESNKLLGYVAMTSRKRDVPLSLLILSSSGSGKTALQDAVLAFCPPEDLVKLTALSGKALFYKERLSLKHKVLALEEGDGAEEASYAIRNLISAGELVSESTIKDLTTGRLVTMENRVEGPSAVFLTTTNPELDAETRSRFFVTSIDESREQTRKILSFQRRAHLTDGLIVSAEVEAVQRRHRNFQRLLKPLAVKNPFAGQLTYGDDRLQSRRDQPKYLNLIKAVAFLRQMQKELRRTVSHGTTVEHIDVDMDDVMLANKLARDVLGHSLDELSRPSRDLLLQLETMVGERRDHEDPENAGPEGLALRPVRHSLGEGGSSGASGSWSGGGFSRRQVREYTGWTNTRLHIHLRELTDFEYIVAEAGRNGQPYRYRLLYDGQGKDGRRFLLGLADPACLEPGRKDKLMEPRA